MPYIRTSEIERVKTIDLLSYLQQREPDELVRLGANSYSTKTHDSLKLSNGCWYWWSRGIGGRSALDYLIKVREMGFLEAVQHLQDSGFLSVSSLKVSLAKPSDKKTFKLPARSRSNDNAIAYIKQRGIDASVIHECIKSGVIFESGTSKRPNVVFVGHDPQGKPRYAALRGCAGNFKGEVAGSDKRYAFKLTARGENREVHVFESAIDALSYATMLLDEGRDWRVENLLSLGGIPPACSDPNKKSIPQAIVQYLADHPDTETAHLHFDNDEPGTLAANSIATALHGQLEISLSPPKVGNDMNDFLLAKRQAQNPNRTPVSQIGAGRIKKTQRERA
jgi:hypothetical protein